MSEHSQPPDLVRLAIDNYNAGRTGLDARVNGNAQNGAAPATRFVVDEIESDGERVITRGELVGPGDRRESSRSRLALIWLFDAAGRVADVRAVVAD